MTFIKIIAFLIAGVNTYFGGWFLLNALNILQSSKYSKGSTIMFSILFSVMGIVAMYLIVQKNMPKTALWIGAGPWLIALVFLFIVMITSDYH